MNTVVNLFDVDEKYFSHPNYPYREHIKNIADSFDDDSHKWSAIFHDLGKLCDSFQTYINPEHRNKKKTTHALIGALLFLYQQGNQLDKASLPVFLSILKHHGNLEDVNTLAYDLSDAGDLENAFPGLIKKMAEVIKIAKIEGCFNLEECSEFFDDEDFVSKNNLGGIDSYFNIKEVFSKLIFADKYEAIFKQKYQENKFDNSENYIGILENHLSKKTNALSQIRNSARSDILINFNNNSEKSIFIIEAPTGIGKTFTALHLALEIVRQKKKKRIITALPMTSIIDQTFEEYSLIIDKEILLKYHHLTISKSYNINLDKEKENEQEYFMQKDSYITKSWAEDKVIITTFNQILNLFYSNRNRDLIKFWTLRDSVIIIDEIQAIPRVLLKDFATTVSLLCKQLNIDFILMSATVPEIKNFFESSQIAELLDNKYFSLDFNNRYILRFDNNIDSETVLFKSIIQQYQKRKSVLIVVNTKKVAFRIYNYLIEKYKESENIFLLSSSFIPKHRKEIISNISKSLGGKKIPILVSTQVIEAGVDLDFDYGFREFSPFYSIIQTAGRVNRENRSEVKESATLTVFPEIGYSPYHQTDLLKDEVIELLSEETRENTLLQLLKKYFSIAMKRTQKEMLLYEKMENLEFQKVIRIFNNNFMKKIPYTIPLFLEIEEGLYEKFHNKLENLYENLKNKSLTLENKMEIKIQMINIYKDVANYVINVPIKNVSTFESFYKDSEMKTCLFDEVKHYYNKETGFKLDSQLPPQQSSEFY